MKGLIQSFVIILSISNYEVFCFTLDANETSLLNNITANIDPNMFPPVSNLPVKIRFKLLSVSDINPATSDFQTIGMLYTIWHDPQLNYTSKSNIDLIDITFMSSKIWYPRLYFPNSKSASRNAVSVPNYRVILFRNGTVEEAQRVILTSHCHQKLQIFPFDAQRCSIRINSISASSGRYTLSWDGSSQEHSVEMSEFKLMGLITQRCISYLEYSECLELILDMDRQYAFYVFAIFFPMMLVVCVSWAAFWVDISAIPCRSTLGALAIMTCIVQLGNLRQMSAHVGYLRAADIYGVVCLIFGVLSFMESHLCNHLFRRKKALAEKKKKQESAEKEKSSEDANVAGSNPMNTVHISAVDVKTPKKREKIKKLLESYDPPLDIASRVCFPAAFLLFNILYWIIFLVVLEQ